MENPYKEGAKRVFEEEGLPGIITFFAQQKIKMQQEIRFVEYENEEDDDFTEHFVGEIAESSDKAFRHWLTRSNASVFDSKYDLIRAAFIGELLEHVDKKEFHKATLEALKFLGINLYKLEDYGESNFLIYKQMLAVSEYKDCPIDVAGYFDLVRMLMIKKVSKELALTPTFEAIVAETYEGTKIGEISSAESYLDMDIDGEISKTPVDENHSLVKTLAKAFNKISISRAVDEEFYVAYRNVIDDEKSSDEETLVALLLNTVYPYELADTSSRLNKILKANNIEEKDWAM
ncbi:MAG: hypothetical protein LBM01_02335 [Christensenellaceae bacterium]|jgi:hypothetical protein|nr:hypothetical protein [Christensenellaceae bacterium]